MEPRLREPVFARVREHVRDHRGTVRPLCVQSSLVLEAARALVADVTSTVDASAIVNQAVGLIMSSRTCTAAAAIAIRTASATVRGQDLKTACEAVISGRTLIDES